MNKKSLSWTCYAKSSRCKHFFRIMKITYLLLFVFIFCLHAENTNSQNLRFTIKRNNIQLEQVLEEIEKQSNYLFVYNKHVNMNQKVSLDMDKKSLKDVLSNLFDGTDVNYSIEGNYIVLSAGKESADINNVKQEKFVTGKVTDNHGEALLGVAIMVKGTTQGTVTDMDGNYSISVPNNKAVLVFNYLGYVSKEQVVGEKSKIDVVLQEDTKQLDEVVVVAYGTQKVRNLTGSMSRLSTDELVDMPVPNIGQKMQGKFSGVQIYQNSGEPNGGISFRVRGQASISGGNSPLVVIDGFPSLTGLDAINPEEIENITVLKDAASSALYGSRAANGVILVTTKQAKEGKMNIEFSMYYGWEKVSNRGKPDVMNAQEFAQFKKEYYEDQARYEDPNVTVPEVYQHPELLTNGTDWYDVLLRTANTQNYNLALSGGTAKIKSSVNLGYNKTEGVIINTYSERFSARANNIFNANDHLKFGLNLGGSYRSGQIPPGLGESRGIIGCAYLMDPQLKYKNDDGTYPISYTQPGMFANPNYYLVLTQRENVTKDINGLLNAFAEIEFIKDLKYKFSANIDLSNQTVNRWTPSTAQGGLGSAPPNPATGEYYSRNYLTWLLENTVTYNKTFMEKHTIDAMLGYSTQKATSQNAKVSASQYPDDEVPWVGIATRKDGSSDASNWYDWAIISYLARLNYNYDGKYLLSATFRRDGCSRFGAYSKFANFPSVSLGWIVSDESFMENMDPLSYLKFRASYGKVGNNNIGNYSYIASASSANYVFNNTIVGGKALNAIGNNDLTWETTNQYDVGIDVGLLNDRIFLIYDYYRKKTDGLLYRVDIPNQSGFSSIQSNIGEFRFWGHEIGLETKNLVGDFKWNTNLNVTFNRNKVMKLGTNNVPWGGNSNQMDYHRLEVGKPLGFFMGYVYDGVYMTQEEFDSQPKHASSMVGTVRMKDINNDGVIDMDDRTMIGDPNPDFIYGMTNEFFWKNFDASFVIAGAVGGDVMDGTYEWTENLDGVFNVRKEVAERWRSLENPGNGKIPRTRSGTTELFRFNNSRWVFNGSYLSLKNLTIGYTFPLKSNPYVKSLRIYGSGQNLFTITGYPGMNPEVNAYGSAGHQQGLDYSSYPVARTFSVGLNVKF